MTRNLPQATFTPIDGDSNRLAITGELADMLHDLHPEAAPDAPVVLELSSETFFQTDWTHELSWSMSVRIGDIEVWDAEIGVASSHQSVNTATVPRFVDWCEFVGESHAELAAYL